jgi:hypothetical protein
MRIDHTSSSQIIFAIEMLHLPVPFLDRNTNNAWASSPDCPPCNTNPFSDVSFYSWSRPLGQSRNRCCRDECDRDGQGTKFVPASLSDT